MGSAAPVSQPDPVNDGLLGSQAMAYNEAQDEFLVVWHAVDSNGNQEIFGRRLDSTGAAIGTGIQLTSYSGTNSSWGSIEPEVAYNPATQGYVLVYTDRRSSSAIKAVPLDEAGAPAGTAVSVSGSSYPNTKASLVYNAQDGEYLVTWAGNNSSRLTRWQRITVSGSGSSQTIGLTGSQGSLYPAERSWVVRAAHNPETNEYLAVIERTNPSTAQKQVIGQRIAADGTPVGSYFPINPSGWAGSPDVVWSSERERFMVLWLADLGDRLKAREVAVEGTPVGTSDLSISVFMSGKISGARLEYSPRSGEFAALYSAFPDSNTASTPRFQRFLGDGTKLGVSDEQVNTVRTAGLVAGAYRPADNSVVAAWTQQVATTDPWTVHARKVELGGYLSYDPIRVRVGDSIDAASSPTSLRLPSSPQYSAPTLPAGLEVCDDPPNQDNCTLGAIIGTLPDDATLVNAETTTHLVTATGGGETATGYVEITRVPRLEQQFRPILRFDSKEKWRPLEVDTFLAEGQVDSSRAHQWCQSAALCSPISSFSDLRAQTGTSDPTETYIDIAGEPNWDLGNSWELEEYRSPNNGCVLLAGDESAPAPEEDIVYDCNNGPRSKIYQHRTTSSGYTYFDHWMFYRFNEFDPGISHEGDWEAFWVAAPTDDPHTFDYAVFSAHEGPGFRYLRDTLLCDGDADSPPVACGEEVQGASAGQRVNVYVANGSHANYPRPCATNCWQTDSELVINGVPTGSPVPEKSFDGSDYWGNNDDAPSLVDFPGPANGWPANTARSASVWTDFPGGWGKPTDPSDPSGSPASPGVRGERWSSPWLARDCTERWSENEDGCPNAVFTYAPALPQVNETVTFTSTSTGNVSQYAWDTDDDGEFDDGYGIETTAVYSTAGVKRVRLKVFGDPQSDGTRDQDTVELEVAVSDSGSSAMSATTFTTADDQASSTSDACAPWEGPFVQVAICDAPALKRALRTGRLQAREPMTFGSAPADSIVASTDAVTQIVGAKMMAPGDKVTLPPAARGKRVFVRAKARDGVVRATFARTPTDARAIRVGRAGDGFPLLRLEREGGREVRPTMTHRRKAR